jgi:hypothetical protein
LPGGQLTTPLANTPQKWKMHQEVVTEKWVKKPSTATTTEVNIDRITSNKQGDNKNT